MTIKIVCKLFDDDATYFLDPILRSEKITKLILYRDSNPYHQFGSLNPKYSGVYQSGVFKLIFRLYQMITKKPCGDVFVGIYEIPHGLLAILAAKSLNRPVIVSIIGNPKYPFRNKGFRGKVTKLIYKWADVITVTGSQSKRFLIESKSIASEKIFVLPNSIPKIKFLNNDKNSEKKYDLVTIGRLSAEKGLLILLDIVDVIRKSIPTISLGIAGKGSQLQDLQLRIAELNLEQNVELLGYVESVRDFLGRGKIFITSSLSEGLPRTAIQSMFGGIPVIASNVGDMSDLVVDGTTGLLVEYPLDVVTFSNKVIELLTDDEKYKRFCENAEVHAKKKYSHEASTNVWNQIFHYLKIDN